MKPTITIQSFFAMIALITTSMLYSCKKPDQEREALACEVTDMMDENHSKAGGAQLFMDEMVAEGIPGISVAFWDDEGMWAGTSGMAKIEDQLPMEICHLQFGQSVAKTYTAVAMLLLSADDHVDLDRSISNYLSDEVLDIIQNEESITVRMLLNHTSGIPEYNDKPNYITYLLQNPGHEFSPMDYLEYTRNADPKFEPGAKYSYTNTNYILATLIMDGIVGDHKKFIQKEILLKHGLNHTFYHNSGFLDRTDVPNSYWDRYSNSQIENCSDMQRTNVGTLVGDDGIIASPMDYVRFLKKLLEGEILEQEQLDEMLTYVSTSDENDNGYGLGIHRDYYKGFVEIGHSGGGIGSGCLLGYFPESDTYYFVGMNIGTSIYSPLFDEVQVKIDAFFDVMLE